MARHRSNPSSTRILTGLGIALLTLTVFAPVAHFDFVNYDDLEFVAENPHVSTGISATNLRWAFANAYAGTGGPLTWISHMADAQLFGLEAGAHHRTSLVLHTCNALLLFAVLLTMTRAPGRSAWVATLFAIHPLHVESVAWVAERKDVLSTTFWLLTTWAYVGYVRQPGPWRYVAMAILFALGLLSKPMVATLPFVLLLLDFWPLERINVRDIFRRRTKAARGPGVTRLVLEKVPLFVLSAISIGLTFEAQRELGAIAAIDSLSIGSRVSNAIVSYVAYIGQAFWPVDLAAFYPHPLEIRPALIVGAALALAVITVSAVLAARDVPYVTVGWFWYVGTLVPVIGIVQLGSHAKADRFTYIPLVGLFIIAAWGGASLLQRAGVSRATLTIAAVALVAACAVVSRAQVHHWENGVALWEHASQVTRNNARAHANLGVALARGGQRGRAIAEYGEALRIEPRYPEAHNNLALALAAEGKTQEALAHYQDAVHLMPDYVNAHTNMANLLDESGRGEEAIAHYREAIRLDPTHVLARVNLAVTLARAGRLGEAIAELEAALRLDPGNEAARKMLEEMKKARS
jgi:protein O-mannosyl-transferase